MHYPRTGAPPWFLELTRFGWTGVDLFFVLSGFLIGRQLLEPISAGERPRLGDFYLRRLFRILPAYWVVLAIYVLVPSAREHDELAAPLVRFLTFTQNLGLSGGAFAHAWSLCIEEQFYLVLPLLALALAGRVRARTIGVLAIAIVLAGIVLRGVLWWFCYAPYADTDSARAVYWEWIYFPTWSRLDGLLAGVVLALVQVFRPAVWNRWQRTPWGVALVAALALGLARPLCEQNRTLIGAGLAFPVLAIGFAALVVFATTDVGTRLLGRVPGARWLATLAYSLYLSHLLVLSVVRRVFERYGLSAYHPATAAAFVVSVLAFAALLHTGVERPFLRLRERFRRAAPVPAPAPAA
jgi:peptidoglycan/LPS O-acetylase OafA/YrhL